VPPAHRWLVVPEEYLQDSSKNVDKACVFSIGQIAIGYEPPVEGSLYLLLMANG